MALDYVALGNRVRQLRKERKLSQERLAELIDISVPHMSNIETGKTKLSLQVLINLANALQVSPDVLLAEQMDARSTVRRMVVERINCELADCTEAQMLMLEKVVRYEKSLLKQYDEKVRGRW